MPSAFGRVLQQIDVFAGLSDDVCEELGELVEARRYAKGELLFRRGEAGIELLIVASGRIKVFLSDEEGEHVLAFLGEGEILGEMALLTGEPRSASAVALVDSRTLVLPKEAFDRYVASNAAVMREIARMMARRQAKTNVQLVPGRPEPIERRTTLQVLTINIDRDDVEEAVQEILAFDFFQRLEARAARLRGIRQG